MTLQGVKAEEDRAKKGLARPFRKNPDKPPDNNSDKCCKYKTHDFTPPEGKKRGLVVP